MTSNKVTMYNIASTIILQGLVFISGPIFSRVLGTNNYGIVAVYLTWVQVASTVFSLQAAGTIGVARVNFSLEDQDKYQSSVFSLSTIAYIIFSILTVGVCFIINITYELSIVMVLLGLVQGWGMYCVSAMNTKYTYEFKANKNFFLSVATSALTIGLSLLLIYVFPAETNYWGRIIGQAAVYLALGIFIMIVIIHNGKTIYNKEYWKFTLPIAIPTIFHLLATLILNQSDKVMIQSMVDNSAAGIYALAYTFGMVINTIYVALNNSWVPFYYDFTKKEQYDEIKRKSRNYIELFTILCMGFILLAREVFHLYADETYWEGTDLIPLFAAGFFFVFLYSFPVNYEFYNKRTKTIAFGTAGAAVINIVLNFFFIKWWGILGAAIATTISHALQFLFHWICAKRINPGQFPFKLLTFVPSLLAVAATCVLYYFTKDLWILRWVIGGLLGIYLLYRIIRRKEIF